MEIKKLTITAYDVVPASIRKHLTITKCNPDVDIATILIKDKLRLHDSYVFNKTSEETSKKKSEEVLYKLSSNVTAKRMYQDAKKQIEVKLSQILTNKNG